MASKVWRKTKLDTQWLLTKDYNISIWLLNITEKMDKDCFEFGLVVIWTIWNNRNAFVMNGKNKDSQGAANFEATFFQEYRNAMQKEEGRPIRVNQKWQKPSQWIIKINFDGSVKKAEKK